MRYISVLLVFLLQGCAAFRMQKPERQFGENLELPAMWESAGVGNDGLISTGWLQTFEDPEMEQLVAEALAHNRDLKAARARLKITEQGTIFGRAGRLPSISASGSGSVAGSRFQDETGKLEPWRTSDDYGLSLNLSWEIDLWGRLRNLHQAAIEDYVAASADFRGLRLSFAAITAKAWCNLITAGQQVELARETRESFARNERITERNYRAGDATALAVQFGRNNVASAERSLINRELARDESARSLETLLGRYPSALIQGRQGRDALPPLSLTVPAGLPSDLLMRRPDLVAAAADVRASVGRADAARKDLLPSISLSGRGSTSSDELSSLIADPRSIAWNAAASIAQTVFRGGSPSAQARQALARNEAAIETFAAIALQAFREVESALAREHSLGEQEKFLAVEERQADLAEKQASRDYSEGLVGILEVLEAQRRAFNARNSMISLRNQRLQNRIDLHLALGGDFETLPEPLPGELRASK